MMVLLYAKKKKHLFNSPLYILLNDKGKEWNKYWQYDLQITCKGGVFAYNSGIIFSRLPWNICCEYAQGHRELIVSGLLIDANECYVSYIRRPVISIGINNDELKPYYSNLKKRMFVCKFMIVSKK